MKRYTKADLQELVYAQLKNLNAMHDLISLMKTQNELLNKANIKLQNEIDNFEMRKMVAGRKR